MSGVGVIGLGKLGACLAAVLADHHQVIGYDTNPETVDTINAGRAPLDEPGLAERIERTSRRSLHATSDMTLLARATNIAFIVVPTPSDNTGRFDNQHVIEAITFLGRALHDRHDRYTVVIVSTVMPGSCNGPIRHALEHAASRPVGEQLSLVYSPEFIALGSVIHDMTHPDVVLVGCDEPYGADATLRVVQPVAPFATVRIRSLLDAEMAKLALNVALSVKIAYANEVATICENVGADAEQVLSVVGQDSRIGPKCLQPGGPASGPCLPRDLVAFDRVAKGAACSALLAGAAHHVHHGQSARVLGQLLDVSGVEHPTIGVLGAAYKPGTWVTDESIGVRVAQRAVAGRWPVVMHDPAASLEGLDVKAAGSAQQVVDESDVVLVATAWPEYAGLATAGKPVVDLWGLLPRSANVHRFGVVNTVDSLGVYSVY